VKKNKNVKEGTGAPGPQPVVDWQMSLIAPEIRGQLDELIIEGASLEGATAAINESPQYSVTLGSVEHYVRSNIDLQRRRIQYIANTTSAITQHVPGDPDAPEKQLINALIMAGLLKTNEKDASPFLNSMMLRRAELTNLELRNKLMRWKQKENRILEERLNAQNKLTRARTKFVDGQTEKLREFVRKLEKKKSITPETLEKIQAIYGLLSHSVAQAAPDMGTVEEQNLGDPNVPRDDGVETQGYYTSPVDSYEAGKTILLKRLSEVNVEVQAEPAGQQRLLTQGKDEV
jgi:hypothetical protein